MRLPALHCTGVQSLSAGRSFGCFFKILFLISKRPQGCRWGGVVLSHLDWSLSLRCIGVRSQSAVSPADGNMSTPWDKQGQLRRPICAVTSNLGTGWMVPGASDDKLLRLNEVATFAFLLPHQKWVLVHVSSFSWAELKEGRKVCPQETRGEEGRLLCRGVRGNRLGAGDLMKEEFVGNGLEVKTVWRSTFVPRRLDGSCVCKDLGAVMQVCGGVMGSFGRQSEEDLQKSQGQTGGWNNLTERWKLMEGGALGGFQDIETGCGWRSDDWTSTTNVIWDRTWT